MPRKSKPVGSPIRGLSWDEAMNIMAGLRLVAALNDYDFSFRLFSSGIVNQLAAHGAETVRDLEYFDESFPFNNDSASLLIERIFSGIDAEAAERRLKSGEALPSNEKKGIQRAVRHWGLDTGQGRKFYITQHYPMGGLKPTSISIRKIGTTSRYFADILGRDPEKLKKSFYEHAVACMRRLGCPNPADYVEICK